MAEDNLKDFTINWILTGFLMFCLVSFAVAFMVANNSTGYGFSDTGDIFNNISSSLDLQLSGSPSDSDTLLNITSNTNPEVSDLGSRDSVATSYEAKGSATNYWETSKILISWIFSGEIGRMLISVFAGIIGFLSYFYIMKHIRTGT